jgi:hypothetical protein
MSDETSIAAAGELDIARARPDIIRETLDGRPGL